jgi:hypothetical protein
VEMNKLLLRDRDELRQQAGVAVDLALLAVQAGFCPASDIVGEAAPDNSRRHKAPRHRGIYSKKIARRIYTSKPAVSYSS